MSSYIYPILVLGGLAIFFGLVLAYASKKFAVEVDEKVTAIRENLPGANCGGCGFAGCDALAAAISEGRAATNACPVGGGALAVKIAAIMGQTAVDKEKEVARVLCAGTCDKVKDKFEYYGIKDCRSAVSFQGGAKSCAYGCLGLGTCTQVCPFDAIHISNGVAVVDEDKCTSCKKCVAACPKQIIQLVPISKKVRVTCSSKDKAKEVMANCKVGCIGCGKCAKTCKFDAITVTNNLAKIDYSKCVSCGQCALVCPTKAIEDELSGKRTKAVIKEDLCIGCSICKKQCKFDAIEGEIKGKHKILSDNCVGCGQCVAKCPKKAIDMK